MKFSELVNEKYLKPIERYDKQLKNWHNIKIKENSEKLVSLRDVSNKIILSPQYYINNIPGAINDCLVRESLVSKLINIANKLPKGYSILVWDAYRNIETQQTLVDHYYGIFKKETKLSGNELLEYTKKFVSLPSLDPLKPSPHNTGAAIDLTICDKDFKTINFGVEFDEFKEEANTFFYEDRIDSLNKEEYEILLNRRILCNLFTEEGFVNYPYEIWHKSYMDQMYCELKDINIATYGSCSNKLNMK